MKSLIKTLGIISILVPATLLSTQALAENVPTIIKSSSLHVATSGIIVPNNMLLATNTTGTTTKTCTSKGQTDCEEPLGFSWT